MVRVYRVLLLNLVRRINIDLAAQVSYKCNARHQRLFDVPCEEVADLLVVPFGGHRSILHRERIINSGDTQAQHETSYICNGTERYRRLCLRFAHIPGTYVHHIYVR